VIAGIRTRGIVDSSSALVSKCLDFFPVELSGGESASSLSNTIKGSLDLLPVDMGFVWHQTRDCFPVTGDDDFLALLDAIEQASEGIFCLERADRQSRRRCISNGFHII
jgi:hypothetical protein